MEALTTVFVVSCRTLQGNGSYMDILGSATNLKAIVCLRQFSYSIAITHVKCPAVMVKFSYNLI